MSEQEIDAIAERLAQRLIGRAKSHLSPTEFAQANGIGLRTVYQALSDNRLACDRVGRRILIPATAKIGG